MSPKFYQYQLEYKPCEQAMRYSEYFAASLKKCDRREGFGYSSINMLVSGAAIKNLLNCEMFKTQGWHLKKTKTNPKRQILSRIQKKQDFWGVLISATKCKEHF